MDLNEQHLRAISKEIRLDQIEMFNHDTSIYRIFYGQEGFTYSSEQKRYRVDKLLMIGFLLCEHYSIDTQGVDLWHLINPKLELTIPRETVVEFVKDLLKIAVNLNFQYIQNLEKRLIE